MRKLKWWMRIVGALYTLIGLGNMILRFADPDAVATFFVHPSDLASMNPEMAAALRLASLPFYLTFLVLGLAMLYFSRQPEPARGLGIAVVLLEAFAWIPLDMVWLATDMPATTAISYLIIHPIIIVTGILCLRQEVRNEPTAI